VTREPVQAFVAVGSNVDPYENIPRALSLLGDRMKAVASSTFYLTQPIEGSGKPPFVNGVWEVAAAVPARDMKFDILRAIEKELGRVRTKDRYAPRPIDLDLVIFGDLVQAEPDLTIPDPDIRTRAFLAVPLLQLAPGLRMPDDGTPLAKLSSSIPSNNMMPVNRLTQSLQSIIGKED